MSLGLQKFSPYHEHSVQKSILLSLHDNLKLFVSEAKELDFHMI